MAYTHSHLLQKYLWQFIKIAGKNKYSVMHYFPMTLVTCYVKSWIRPYKVSALHALHGFSLHHIYGKYTDINSQCQNVGSWHAFSCQLLASVSCTDQMEFDPHERKSWRHSWWTPLNLYHTVVSTKHLPEPSHSSNIMFVQWKEKHGQLTQPPLDSAHTSHTHTQIPFLPSSGAANCQDGIETSSSSRTKVAPPK